MNRCQHLFESFPKEEAIKWKKVVRNGKIVRIPYTTQKNKKIKRVNGKPIEVTLKPAEKRRRSKASIRSQRKLKSKRSQIVRKRNRSLKRHTW
jgi:hypothetical protein